MSSRRSSARSTGGEKRKSRPPSYRSREASSESEDDDRRSDDSDLLTASSSEVDTDEGDRRNDRSRRRLVPPRRSSPAPSRRSSSPPSGRDSPPPSGQRKVMLMLGIAVILCLTFLAGFAVSRYFGSSTGGAATETETVTITADGKTNSGAGPKASGSATATKTSKPASSGSASGGTSAADAKPTGATGAYGTGGATTFPGLSKNGVGIGMLPDYKDQRLSDINEGLGAKFSFYGWYAQLPETGEWDGSQLLEVKDDLKASGAIFQPAVMPNKHNWHGLSEADNYQALAIAKVIREFTDEGIEVWLRLAHEINWYLSDGTYSGGTGDDGVAIFKEAWKTVAAAVADNPLVKMFFTPNVAASLDDYVRYFPDDLSTVHVIGVDYYPKSASESFLKHMQPFYDKYCTDGSILFAQGETGIAWEGTAEEKLAWIEQHTSEETVKAMPYLVGVSWFNYDKEVAFKVWKKDDEANNTISREWFADGTVAEGAKMGNW